jgi:hypothetical protein
LTGSYTIEATFLNPDGQHLDSRDLPSLTILKVAITLFSAVFIFWTVYVFVKRRKFLPIHVYCGLINVFYLGFLIFHLFSLNAAQATDDATVFTYLRIAFEFTYDTVLFWTILVLSSGWGLLNVELTTPAIVNAIAASTVFVSASFAQFYASVDLTQVLLLFVQLGAGLWIWHLLHTNSDTAQNRVKAHLLAIQRDGIMPITTPIYQKLRIFQLFLNVAVVAFVSFLMLNVVLSVLRSQNWIVGIANNVIQFGIIIALMALYRPRRGTIDMYMQPDVDFEGPPRGEVALEELQEFVIEAAPDGMREWEEGMNLPLQPLLVSSTTPRHETPEQPYQAVGERPTRTG